MELTIDVMPELCETGEMPTPEAAPSYSAQPDTEAEPLYPGLRVDHKDSLSRVARFLMAEHAEPLRYRTGAADGGLVVYPTNEATASAFFTFSHTVGSALFTLVYE